MESVPDLLVFLEACIRHSGRDCVGFVLFLFLQSGSKYLGDHFLSLVICIFWGIDGFSGRQATLLFLLSHFFLIFTYHQSTMDYSEINVRYSKLAESDCCLSCGGAINHADARLGETAVDLGSGRGTDVLRLADEVGPQGFVYGIDISDGMLEKARQNAARMEVENVRFLNSPLEKLDLESEIAHLVISNCTINHSSDKDGVWREIYRILKKGGRFVVSDIYAKEKIDQKYSADPELVAQCWAGAVTREAYLATLHEAGFQQIMILEESKPYRKGEAEVVSFTIAGKKPGGCCCQK